MFSSLGISRQRDGLSFEEVDYQANRNLIDVCVKNGVRKFVDVSMLGAEDIAELAITKAHERVVAELASDVVGKPVKVTVIPLWFAYGVARFIGLLNRQLGDLATFIVTAGEVDGVGPARGKTTLRSYFEELA